MVVKGGVQVKTSEAGMSPGLLDFFRLLCAAVCFRSLTPTPVLCTIYDEQICVVCSAAGRSSKQIFVCLVGFFFSIDAE